MQFLVLGYDGKDSKAMERRLAVREQHLVNFKDNYDKGIFLYASAILSDDGKMIGSLVVCEFESLKALKSQWLDNEVYVTGNVWQNIKIQRAQVPPFILDK
ncbi:MAG TPA: YciI family protein [Victivallales bacterium]|nr:YciI family protein [Victivallales bacterium]